MKLDRIGAVIMAEVHTQNLVRVTAPDPDVAHTLAWKAETIERIDACVTAAIARVPTHRVVTYAVESRRNNNWVRWVGSHKTEAGARDCAARYLENRTWRIEDLRLVKITRITIEERITIIAI